jgi:hypothetical protein
VDAAMTISIEQIAEEPTKYLGHCIECHATLIGYYDSSKEPNLLEDGSNWFLAFKMWLVRDDEDLSWLANEIDFTPDFSVEIVSDELLSDLLDKKESVSLWELNTPLSDLFQSAAS